MPMSHFKVTVPISRIIFLHKKIPWPEVPTAQYWPTSGLPAHVSRLREETGNTFISKQVKELT